MLDLCAVVLIRNRCDQHLRVGNDHYNFLLNTILNTGRVQVYPKYLDPGLVFEHPFYLDAFLFSAGSGRSS